MVATTRRALTPVLALLLLLPLLAVWPSTPADAANADNAERIAASDYTATGIAVSKRVFADGADAAVLTRDDHFPDALASSALAASVNGPVLFTDTDRLTGSTATELNRVLDPGDTVYITGGTAAVSEDVADEVRDQGYAVTRLAGETRVETAAAIAEEVGVPNSGRVLIARAFGPPGRDITTGWVDSVTCGAYANRTTTPVLLTRTEALDASTAAALDEIGATDATICGGEFAVSAQVAEDLRGAGLDVDRVFGATRVETAVAVAEQLFGYSSAAGHTYLLVNGYGDNFGWGLAAAPLAGSLGAPILLVGSDFPTDCDDEAQPARNTLCHLETVGGGRADVVAIGRTAQIGDTVLDAAAAASGGTSTSNNTGPLGTPTGVSTSNVSTQSEGRVKVTWKPVDDPDGRLAGYNVHYGTDSPDTRAGPSNPTVGPATTSFTVGALQLDTTYRFAVTSVTNRGAESDRSATATETTTAPSVDLTSPTSAAPAQLAPSTGLTVKVDYTASEGGTLRLFHRPDGADTWKPFGDAFTAAATDGTTRSVDVTAPGGEGTYDLRARLSPSGSVPIDDVEIGALQVTEPQITLTKPTSGSKTEALPGTEGLEVVFDYDTNEDGIYVVALRGPDGSNGDPWTEVAQGPAPAGHVAGETATFTAPTAEGFYDVRVRIETDAGDTHNRIEKGSLYVVTPEISLTAPAEPTLAGAGQPFETAFQTNAGGDYLVQHRTSDEWKTFASDVDEAEGQVHAGGTRGTDAATTVRAPSTTGSYDVSVVLDPNADRDNHIRTTAHDDGSSPARLDVASLALDAPTNGAPAKVEPGTDVTVTFTLDSPVEVDAWIDVRPHDGETWEALHGPFTPGNGDGTTEGNKETVSAPTDPADYDLRVRVQPTAGAGAVVDAELGALQVQSSPVDLTTPSAGEPAEVDNDEGGATFSVTFDSEITGDYTIECINDHVTTNVCTNNEGQVDPSGTTTVSGIGAPTVDDETHDANTYDVRVTVTPETGDSADDKVTGGLRVGHVDVISPAPDGSDEYGSGETFTVTFDVNADGAYEIQQKTNETDWQTMKDQNGTDDATGRVEQTDADDGTPETHDVQAPAPPDTYQLRVLFTLDPEGDGTKTVAGETEFSVSDTSSGVTVDLIEPSGDPSEEVAPGDPVQIQFDVSGLDAGATTAYGLAYRPDGSTDNDWESFGTTAQGQAANGTNITAVTAPDEDGLLDVRVVLDAGAEDVNDKALDVTSADDPNLGAGTGAMVITVEGDGFYEQGVDEIFTVTASNGGAEPEHIRVRFEIRSGRSILIEEEDVSADCDFGQGRQGGHLAYALDAGLLDDASWPCIKLTREADPDGWDARLVGTVTPCDAGALGVPPGEETSFRIRMSYDVAGFVGFPYTVTGVAVEPGNGTDCDTPRDGAVPGTQLMTPE